MAAKTSIDLTPTGADVDLSLPANSGIFLIYIDNTSGGNLEVVLYGDDPSSHVITNIPTDFYSVPSWLAIKTIVDSGTTVDKIIGYK